MFDRKLVLKLLQAWANYSERHWYELGGLGCYGTGYNSWGVQTNQKYVTALVGLSQCSDREAAELGIDCEWARQRAITALRFSLQSHKSSAGTGTDGQQWGHTWISALGLERMMGAVHVLWPYLDSADRAAFERLLVSEANYLLHDYGRGAQKGVVAGLWGSSGKNHPESNGWNGALLWRAASLFPEHPDASAWRERSHRFLINTVSVASDAGDATLIDGQPVKDRHVGANFFPHYALDHHGYFNVGYMVICTSGAAMLHFDLKAQGVEAPESLHWHQADLWQVLRRFIFSDGRLARLGGDTRVRYAYCQEYLLPALLYAADQLGEPYARELIEKQLQLIEQEARANGDGSFYSRRLNVMAATEPYYYTRLESDRACVLAMLLLYSPYIETQNFVPALNSSFEASVAGNWQEPEYDAALHRSEKRLAAFSWRALGFTQGLCLPPYQSDLAEWEGNLAGQVCFMGDDGIISGGQTARRRLESHHIEPFEGGFLTYGAVTEGLNLSVAEGWTSNEMGQSQLVFAALPDGHTVIGLQFCRAGNLRAFTRTIKGLRWCVPNDVYNDFNRRLITEHGETSLDSPPAQEEVLNLQSNWVNIDEAVSAVNFYGAPTLSIHRTTERRAGKLKSLFIEEICSTYDLETRSHNPAAIVLDCGWAMLSGVGAKQTAQFSTQNNAAALDLPDDCRGLKVRGIDGRTYALVANFGAASQSIPWPFSPAARLGLSEVQDDQVSSIELIPGEARLYVLNETA